MADDSAAFEASVRWLEERGSPPAKASLAASKARWGGLHGTPSEEGLGAAEDFWRRFGNPFELATVLEEHASTLMALRQAAAAGAAWEEAFRIYSRLGAKKRVEKMLQTRQSLGH